MKLQNILRVDSASILNFNIVIDLAQTAAPTPAQADAALQAAVAALTAAHFTVDQAQYQRMAVTNADGANEMIEIKVKYPPAPDPDELGE